jgi:hypothetical protein
MWALVRTVSIVLTIYKHIKENATTY